MSLHCNFKTQQSVPAGAAPTSSSVIPTGSSCIPHFPNNHLNTSSSTSFVGGTQSQSSQNQSGRLPNSSSNQLFTNMNNSNISSTMNSNPHELMQVNANNHPDKNGRPIIINMHSKTSDPIKVGVYENNHKIEHPEHINLIIQLEKVFDHGAFGHVRTAYIFKDHERKEVAVKQVLQEKRYRNRELPMMKQLSHRNIVTLLYYYYHFEDKKQLYLNLVMECIPSNLNKLIQQNNKNRKNFRQTLPHGDLYSASIGPVGPLLTIKLCMYQIFRGLAYIHSKGICHRDIKPNNLLFNGNTGVLKICDFGSAKQLRREDTHVSYICARYYRAPELLFGATNYTEKIDLWSTGVVFSELLLGEPIFHENSGLDQLVLIISKLGTPSKEQIKAMNQKYAKYEFPFVYSQPWESLFPCSPTDALDLISKLFRYDPSHRIAPLHACAHPFFDELREPNKKWLGKDLPPLFDFTPHELSIDPSINNRLLPFKNKTTVNNISYLQQPLMCNSRVMAQPHQSSVNPSQPNSTSIWH